MLVAGLTLSLGRRTVAAALSQHHGTRETADFTISIASSTVIAGAIGALAQLLLALLTAAFVPAGPILVGIDETIERQRGLGAKPGTL